MAAAPESAPARPATSAATRVSVAVLGSLAAVAGLEHGIGELLASRDATGGWVIESWDDTEVFSQLSGEPAFTVLPSMSVSGVLTVVMSALFGVLAVRLGTLRYPGTAMALASVALFAVGGGFGPPLVGVVLSVALGLAARRVTSQPGRCGRGLARSWRPLLVLTALAYLGLFPGTVLLHWWFGMDSAALVAGLTAAAFLGLALTLPAARAHDRLAKGSRPPTGSAAR